MLLLFAFVSDSVGPTVERVDCVSRSMAGTLLLVAIILLDVLLSPGATAAAGTLRLKAIDTDPGLVEFSALHKVVKSLCLERVVVGDGGGVTVSPGCRRFR